MDIILIMNKFTKLRLFWNIQSSIWNPLNEHTYRRYCYWVMFTIVLSRRLRVNSSFLSIGYILAHSVDEIVKHLNALGLHPLWRIILMCFGYFDVIICDNISMVHVQCTYLFIWKDCFVHDKQKCYLRNYFTPLWTSKHSGHSKKEFRYEYC